MLYFTDNTAAEYHYADDEHSPQDHLYPGAECRQFMAECADGNRTQYWPEYGAKASHQCHQDDFPGGLPVRVG